MKLATVSYDERVYAGLVKDENFYSFQAIAPEMPNEMVAFIEGYDRYKPIIKEKLKDAQPTCKTADAVFLSPLKPKTFRDFMSFEEHVQNSAIAMNYDDATKEKMLKIWRMLPAFYFSNSNAFFGTDEPIKMHPASQRFDMEFEVAVIIGKEGGSIDRKDAKDYIFGLSILNDWSARDIQAQEMMMQLGPAKGKDYANSMGPVIVTMDELEQYQVPGDPERWDMTTKLYRNGELLRENNTKTIYHTYAEMIEYASRLTRLYPGEVLGSGTIGGGALLEYLGAQPFIHEGDKIDMEVEGLGTLKMQVI